MKIKSKVLIIAGSDSSGGAGIQADIKTVSSLGSYAMTAITAVTSQNTTGVKSIFTVSPLEISKQIEFTSKDIRPDAIKIGMLSNTKVINAVLKSLSKIKVKKVILDPVMVAKGGAALLQKEAVSILKSCLLPRAMLLTPNIPEAEALVGREIQGENDMKALAKALFDLGPNAVLLKGGHMNGAVVRDILVTENQTRCYENLRIDTLHTHGTGCTLASSIAAGVANGLPIEAAVEQAEWFLHKAIKTAPKLGGGHGPINHLHTVKKGPKPSGMA